MHNFKYLVNTANEYIIRSITLQNDILIFLFIHDLFLNS